MTERLSCQSEDCAATLLPETASKTGGICMPCYQKKLRLEKEAYLAQNRKDINRYAGVTDPVEILKIMHVPRKRNPLENDLPYVKSAQELYVQLTNAERERLESYAISLIEEGDFDQAGTILLSLACFTNTRIDRGLVALVSKGRFYPGILFKESNPVIRDELIKRVEWDSSNRNHLLLALAWIGDDEVVRLFAKWRRSPPQWASELYVAPDKYACEAGWELDANGGKRLLFHPDSYPFEADVEDGLEPNPAVVILKEDDQSCPWCKSTLTVLFDYNLRHPSVQFMKLEGERLRIASCMHCNCYGTLFFKVNLNGDCRWGEYNSVPSYLPEPLPDTWIEKPTWRAMRLSERPIGTYEAAYWTLETPTSKIGGHPAWIQDAEYPACPCCSKTMKFVAQVDREQVSDSEGIYYAFLCEACLMVAVNYQQT